MNDKLNLKVTIKPALTVERIREELADMVGMRINAETSHEVVRRLNAIGLFDFSMEAKPACTVEHQTEQDRLSKIVSAELVKAQPGDLVVFRAEAGSVTADDVNALRKHLQAIVPDGVNCVIVAGDLDITSMSEEQLRSAGLMKVRCTDERPCVNCFSGQGECEVGPYGGPELLEQARALCQAIERLPAGEHQTNLISKIADATFALQNLQSTGDYFWPRPMAPELTQAAQSVLAERRRQVEVEGWTPEHDDRHNSHELAEAAACYSLAGVGKQFEHFQMMWPWEPYWFKGGDQRRMLVKAGALLLAEIERLDRQSAAAAAPDDMTQFLERTDFEAAEKVASDTVANQRELPAGEDDCEGCKI